MGGLEQRYNPLLQREGEMAAGRALQRQYEEFARESRRQEEANSAAPRAPHEEFTAEILRQEAERKAELTRLRLLEAEYIGYRAGVEKVINALTKVVEAPLPK